MAPATKTCNAITNGKRLHRGLKAGGVDGRSAGARRFKDLVRLHAEAFGGFDRLSHSDQALVRQAATLQLREEQLQELVVKGERIDADELIRLTNNVRRCLASIKGAKPAEPGKGGSLSDYLSGRGAAA